MNCQKHLFSIPDDQHYLNGAYLSPLLKSVEEAGKAGIEEKRIPWNIKPEDFFSDSNTLRELFARVINAEDARNIAIMPSVSYGMSTVARNLPRTTDQKIIVAGDQFPSNIYPWKRYCADSGAQLQIIEAPSAIEGRGRKWNERILEAIDEHTLMVAISRNHWADGTLFDLNTIGETVRKAGAYLVVDGTQSVGALPFDAQQVKPDALICAGYKWLMGPYAMALGFFSDRLAEGIPLEENWITRKDSEKFSELLNYSDAYQPGAERYDVGERSNFILVPMMIEALRQIFKWNPNHVQSYCRQLTKDLTEQLAGHGYHIENPEWRAHHLFGIRLPDHINMNELKKKLDHNNIHISVRGSAIRISPNVYNNDRDIAALRNVLLSL